MDAKLPGEMPIIVTSIAFQTLYVAIICVFLNCSSKKYHTAHTYQCYWLGAKQGSALDEKDN